MVTRRHRTTARCDLAAEARVTAFPGRFGLNPVEPGLTQSHLAHAAGAGPELVAPIRRSPIFNSTHDRDANNAAAETTAFVEGRVLSASPPVRRRFTSSVPCLGTTPSTPPDSGAQGSHDMPQTASPTSTSLQAPVGEESPLPNHLPGLPDCSLPFSSGAGWDAVSYLATAQTSLLGTDAQIG